MNKNEAINKACQVLRRRVRFDGARISLPATPFPGDDTAEIRAATKLYTETWIVPLLDAIESGDLSLVHEYYEFEPGHDMKAPNDPKLSDGRAWRDRCAAAERRGQEAAGVTRAPVRCSAWLGDLGVVFISGRFGRNGLLIGCPSVVVENTESAMTPRTSAEKVVRLVRLEKRNVDASKPAPVATRAALGKQVRKQSGQDADQHDESPRRKPNDQKEGPQEEAHPKRQAFGSG